MPDDRITDAKTLIAEISAFGEKLEERRRFERKTLFWAATVDVRGQRAEGTIIDFSPGGARLRFDADVAEGEELTLALKQLAELGAKVVWRRHGEAGIQFLLAPEEVAARVQGMLEFALAPTAPDRAATADAGDFPAPSPLAVVPVDAVSPAYVERSAAAAQPASATVTAMPAAPASARRSRLPLPKWAVLCIAALATLAGGAIATSHFAGRDMRLEAAQLLPVTVGATDQHSCSNLMGRVNGATNSIDFDLSVASAVSAKCLDINHLGPSADDLNRRMLQAAKRPVR